MTPANTLMTLSSRGPSGIQQGGGQQQVSAASVVAAQQAQTQQDVQWPTNLYHLSLPNSGG
jgi:hypothetical protein